MTHNGNTDAQGVRGRHLFGAFLGRLGPLRAMLVMLLIVLVAMAPFALAPAEDSAWSILVSMVAPALVPIVLLLAFFDAVMARIIMPFKERRDRYSTVLWTYAVICIMLM